MKRNRNKKRQLWGLFAIFSILCIGIAFAGMVLIVNYKVTEIFGPADPETNLPKKLELNFVLYGRKDDLLNPLNNSGKIELFVIKPNDTAYQIANNLATDGYIKDASIFVDYLIYKGYDRLLNSGEFSLTPGLNAVEIAEKIHRSSGDMTIFTILPGWRVEEIAKAMEIYQFNFSPAELIEIVHHPQSSNLFPEIYRKYNSLEGFLFPGEYKVSKAMSLSEFLDLSLTNFDANVTPKMIKSYKNHGLTTYEAVTLASIVEKEEMIPEEGPLIASVFYNRLAAGMKLESDPTVQYAIGFSTTTGNWWKNPLNASDLLVQSSYNTYLNPGLPPAPICNPGFSALNSVAFPETTNYYYFRAACDNSGKHVFSETFQEHLQNSCQ